MKIICVFLSLMIALGLPAAGARTKKTPDPATSAGASVSNYNRQGVEAGKAGDWDKAIENFKRAVEADPKSREANDNLALAHRQRGLEEMKKESWDAAISDFTECLKHKEGDLLARRYRAFAYLRKGDAQNALEDYNLIVKEKKDDVETLTRRAFVEVQLKDYDKAIADYSSVLKQQPKNVDAYLGRSHVYEVTKKPDLGLADVDAILKIQPENADALNRKKRLEAQKTRDQPGPAATPVLEGTPIPRASGQNGTAPQSNRAATPATSPAASPK